MNKFTFIELFAGIGGFRQALDGVGGRCVFASEIDKFATQSYEAVYGEVPSGDITEIEAADVPDHDLLTAGFPCQSFSVAGQRKGFEDTRGTLFFEIARIADEKKPKLLLLENVKGLVNHDKGRTLDTMIRTLNDIGYLVDFDILNSKFYGVPQNRERIFIVAIRDDLIVAEPWTEESLKGQTVIPRGKRRMSDWVKSFNFSFPNSEEVTTRLRDILETEVDEKYYLDNERVAKLVGELEERDRIEGAIGHHPFSKKYEFKGYNSEVSPTLIATDYKAPKTVLEAQKSSITEGVNCLNPRDIEIGGQTRMQSRVYGVDGQSVALTSFCDRLNIAEPQMLGHVDIKGHDAIKRTYSGEESFTLTSQDQHGVALGKSPKYRIRKLTPLECWRLQGFPDEAHETAKAAGVSDSQRYKQAGNAVTVNVIKAIGERLLPYL